MRKLTTQSEVDAEIDRLMVWALAAERRRDEAPHESAWYWYQHDRAMHYHECARRLMPAGS
jgi:hypothetical protein